MGGGRTRGPEGESPAAAPGCRPARTIGVLPAGEGRRRRCLQAWRGLCALRWWLSLSDCSKAAEKSAAVPLPVEAAAAAAEDAHWRSQGAPRRSRPRPRSAPRSYLAPRRQVPRPGGSRRPGCAPGPGGRTEPRLGLCEASSHLGLVLQIRETRRPAAAPAVHRRASPVGQSPARARAPSRRLARSSNRTVLTTPRRVATQTLGWNFYQGSLFPVN
uniref:Uncharacterized protein n=1 Tax=Rangifer tarandus platyrhynchus TaxID=3082113 RepID=A0ACB0F717_RANTA|nr:unnamed protein product [Rangifer tarandus platyrhynchus]